MSRSTVEVDIEYLHSLEADAKRIGKLKSYGYGIVDKDGNNAVGIVLTESEANNYASVYLEHKGIRYSVVPLFYEDQS